MADRVNMVLATPRDAGSWLAAAVATHPEVGGLVGEDFEEIDGQVDTFPLNTFDPTYVATDTRDAYSVMADRVAGTAPYIAWTPARFIEFAHVQWAILNGLVPARIVFCLPDPVTVVWRRYQQHLAPTGVSLAAALESCEQEMAQIGRWEERGQWDRYFEDVPESSWLIEGGTYALAVQRSLKLRSDDVHVALEVGETGRDSNVLKDIFSFLELGDATHPATVTSDTNTIPGVHERAMIQPHLGLANERLAAVLGHDLPW